MSVFPSPLRSMLALGCVALVLPACGGKSEATYPKEDRLVRRERHGSLTGEGGMTLFGAGSEKEGAGTGIGVNGFLWRASLDTLSFLPITSADPFGGTILTDWYEDPKVPGERSKVNVAILDKALRADGVKVSVFKQRQTGGQWRDVEADPAVARRLEETILTRARDLRVARGGK